MQTQRRAPLRREIAVPAVAVVVALVAAGCGDSVRGSGWGGEVRDSSGITLVHNPVEPLWSDAERWSVEEELVVRADESRPETLFGYVADLAVDGEGRLYVLDQQAQVVRVFGADGEPLRRLVGPGEGPGELGPFALSLIVRGDTVRVVDWGQARISRFSTDGAFLGSDPVPTEGAARTWWSEHSGTFYFRSLARFTDDEGRWQGRDALLGYRPGGRPDTLVVFDYAQSDLGSPDAPNVPLVTNGPSWAVLRDGRIAWLVLEEERVHIQDPVAGARWIVSSDAWSRRAPTAAEVEVMEEKLGEKMEMLGGSRAMLDQLPVEAPDRLPTITSVRAGPANTLWVQRMGAVEDIHPMVLNGPDPPTGFGGGTWDVLDGEGRYLGSVELPPRLRVFRITGDAVYGVRRDALDVEEVVRLAIRGVPRTR